MRRAIALSISLLALACVSEKKERVTLAFTEHGQVRITTRSPKEDSWAARFNQLEPSSETITVEKSHGEVDAVEHSAISDPDLLQKFFADVDMTIRYNKVDGVSELEIYPATSSRATREEREEFDRRVHVAASAYVTYVNAMRRLYDYLDSQPQRAEHAFKQFETETDEEVEAVSKEEKTLIVDVRHAMRDVLNTAPEEKAQDRFFDLADRVNDPFPATVIINVPHVILSSEGFKKKDAQTVIADVISPIEALNALDGRWLSPDPIASAFKDDAQREFMWRQPRHAAASVTADEIAKAYLEQLKPKAVYRVRWIP